MAYAIKTAKTRFIFTEPDVLPTVRAAASAAGIPDSHIFLLEGHLEWKLNIEDLVTAASATPITPYYRIPPGKKNSDVCGYLNFSSGTTGLPKAVMLLSLIHI